MFFLAKVFHASHRACRNIFQISSIFCMASSLPAPRPLPLLLLIYFPCHDTFRLAIPIHCWWLDRRRGREDQLSRWGRPRFGYHVPRGGFVCVLSIIRIQPCEGVGSRFYVRTSCAWAPSTGPPSSKATREHTESVASMGLAHAWSFVLLRPDDSPYNLTLILFSIHVHRVTERWADEKGKVSVSRP